MSSDNTMDYLKDLQRLDELTKHIDELTTKVDRGPDGWIYYKDVNGNEDGTRSRTLFLDPLFKVRVMLIEGKKGFVSNFHDYRDSRAIGILFEGIQRIEYLQEDREGEVYRSPSYVYLSPGVSHRNIVEEDMRGVVVTMPAILGYHADPKPPQQEN